MSSISAFIPTPGEDAQRLWEGLMAWVNTDATIPPQIKAEFVRKINELRLKMQAQFVEIQKRSLQVVAEDIEMEGELRRMMRENWPYMDAIERASTYKAFAVTNEDKLKRLENQLAGFDLFDTVGFGVSSLTDNTAVPAMAAEIRNLDSQSRKRILNTLLALKDKVDKDLTSDQPASAEVKVTATNVE